MDPFALIMFGTGALILLLSFMAMYRRRKRNRMYNRRRTDKHYKRAEEVGEVVEDVALTVQTTSLIRSGRSSATHSRSSGDDHGSAGQRDGGWFRGLFDRSPGSGGGSGGGGSSFLDD